MNLNHLEKDLREFLHIFSSITEKDFAIFNNEGELIASTDAYLQFKGKDVHKASLIEVMERGIMTVNKPGHMPYCAGCRFAHNCPATLELLTAITIGHVSVGVISLTTFSQGGHKEIEDRMKTYVQFLENASKLISYYVANVMNLQEKERLGETIRTITSELDSDYLFFDEIGRIMQYSDDISEYIPHCNYMEKNILELFPQEISKWISATKSHSTHTFIRDHDSVSMTLMPIGGEGKLKLFALKINKRIHKESQEPSDYLEAIIGKTGSIVAIKELISKLVHSKSTILITGETGTGKELIARALHFTSPRKNKVFLPVNCASIPEALFESELFGYEEGAFTGAKKGGKIGTFEYANGGTVFLDEIGELPVYLQAKLLRTIQEKQIQRIGSNIPIPIDVRIISATNIDLEKAILENRFREDLYYRINVIPIFLPPLNQRKEDIEMLAYHFMKKYSVEMDKKVKMISEPALNALMAYSWPGNIRELENAIEYALNMEESVMLDFSSLPERIKRREEIDLFSQGLLQINEANMIKSILDQNGWNLEGKKKAAEALGISLRTLYRKMAALSIEK